MKEKGMEKLICFLGFVVMFSSLLPFSYGPKLHTELTALNIHMRC